jgi:hypothetical protein
LENSPKTNTYSFSLGYGSVRAIAERSSLKAMRLYSLKVLPAFSFTKGTLKYGSGSCLSGAAAAAAAKLGVVCLAEAGVYLSFVIADFDTRLAERKIDSSSLNFLLATSEESSCSFSYSYSLFYSQNLAFRTSIP